MAEGQLPEGWEEIAKRIAKMVAQGRSPGSQLAQDLCDNIVSHVWERRSSFDPAKGSFKAWCDRVAKNLATDLLREQSRRKKWESSYFEEAAKRQQSPAAFDPEDRNWKNDQSRVVEKLDGPFKFCDEQLNELETLPPRRRVIALAIAGVWSWVPTEQWKQWLREAELDESFPPSECCLENGFPANLLAVADWLGQSEDVVRQHFYRSKKVLANVLEKLR